MSAQLEYVPGMEINGLPLHPLVIHATVVFVPLLALCSVAYAVAPRWRQALRWPLAVLGVLSIALVWAATFSGEDLLEERFAAVQGPLAEQLREHEDLGEQLRNVASLLGLVALVAALVQARAERTAWLRWVLAVVLVVGAGATLVLTFQAGEAGARAVYGS